MTGDVNSWECVSNFNVLTSATVYGGDGIGGSKRYVDLTGYKKLIIKGYGVIRLFYNWHQKTGEETEDVKPMEYITIEGTEVKAYEFDIQAFMASKGISHFHLVGVKGSGNCFVESISALDGTETADFAFAGIGHPLPSVTNALADATVTSIDVTGVNNTSALSFVSANPNCLFVANAGQLSNTQNVIVDGICANLVLTDGYAFRAPVTFTATAATYATTLDATAKAGTLCLPFATTIPAGVEAFTLTYTAGASAALATHLTAGTIPANTPVLLNGSGEKDFAGSGTVSAAATNVSGALTGVFAATTVPEGSYVLQNGADGVCFYKVVSTITASPFRAYLTATGATARIGITYSDATAIDAVKGEEGIIVNGCYDLQGRRVSKPTRGLYIIRGKKTVIVSRLPGSGTP